MKRLCKVQIYNRLGKTLTRQMPVDRTDWIRQSELLNQEFDEEPSSLILTDLNLPKENHHD